MDTNDKAYVDSLLSRQVRFTATGSDLEVLSSNPRRVGLILSASTVGRLTFFFGEASVDSQGIHLPVNSQTIILYRRDIGSLISQSLHVISTVGGVNASLIEVFEP